VAIDISGGAGARRSMMDPSTRKAGGDHKTVYQPSSVEEAQGSNKNVGASDRASQVDSVKTVQADTRTEQAAPKPIESQARPMGEADVIDQLFKLQKSPTPENKQILLMMIQHGIATSEENFELIMKLRKGRNSKNALESAVVSLAKGLADVPNSADIVSLFMNSQLHTSSNLQRLLNTLSQFRATLNAQGQLFNSGLLAGLSGIVSDLEGILRKLNAKSSSDRFSLTPLKRGELLTDFKALFGLLSGIEQQAQNVGNKGAGFLRSLSSLQGEIETFLYSLSSQMIISKDSKWVLSREADQFLYWQIPNPFGGKQSNVDILIRREGGSSTVNMAKTRFIMRTETPELGELGIVMDLEDRKIWYLVQSEENQTQFLVKELTLNLKERMETIQYDLAGLQTLIRRLDLKKLLLPTFNLDDMSRVIAEV